MHRVCARIALRSGAPRAFHATSPLLAKVIPFRLADIGEGILHVEVLQLFVKEGDVVKAFDRICEVQSDKASVEITSRFDGIVKKVHISQGATTNVGDALVDLEVADDIPGGSAGTAPPDPATPPAAAYAAPAAAAATAPAPAASNGKVLAVPSTRRIAKENNIDLANVVPTGKGGRVMKEDVLAFLERKQVVPEVSEAQAHVAATASDRVVKLTGVRKAMVKSMTAANAIPAFGACDEIEMSTLIATRASLKKVFLERSGGKLSLSFMPFFLKAASLALLKFPDINAHTNADCSELHVKGSHNISFAMDSANGLIVPNVKNVQDKTLYQVAEDLAAILEKGKAGSVSRESLEGGTFTLSNIGSIGLTYASPVIMPPQVAIGALGRTQKVPRFDSNGNVVAANIMCVSWAADHRVVDGAAMTRYSNLFKEYLENPVAMLVDMK